MDAETRERTGLLVVSHDEAGRRALHATLSSPAWEVFAAASCLEAERLLDEHEIALVVLDVDQAGEAGGGAVVRLRRRVRDGTVPLVVLSERRDIAARSSWYALGADEVIGKPYDPELLTASVAARLRRAEEITRWARRDMLTGLPNRAAFQRRFERMQEREAAARLPLSLAILDLDGLKVINDAYGHEKGDEVLKAVAEIVSAYLRKSDVLARWGGEEFVVLFPDADEAGAASALEHALAALRAVQFSGQGETGLRRFQATFSAGVTEVARGATLEAALREADRILYRAKSGGRNMVLTSRGPARLQRRVLVVEDDAATAALVKGLLAADGLDAVVMPDGARVAARLPRLGVSLVILDVMLPGDDGFEVLRGLKRSPGCARLPVLMLTGKRDPADVAKGLELGADDYVVKPFSPVELQARVRRLLRRS